MLPTRWLLAVSLGWCLLAHAPGLSASAAEPPRLKHLGRHSLKITTSSPEAQRAFDRGLNLAYSFGHYAAEQEFRAALKADPDCAMAYWGIALVNGPHINFPMVPPDKAAAAWEALGRATNLASRCAPLEQALIHALEHRYANPQPEDRSSLDQAYANAMQLVRKEFPTSADAAVLCAEALMDLHPWDLWANNAPQPWTPEIQSMLEDALRLDARHPGANHYYIHVVEASPHPELGLTQARHLRNLVPDSSHMVHMPAHIYSRIGQWERAAAANRQAMKVDALYRSVYPRPGFYSLYMAHNAHFLAWVSMMQGRSQEALSCAHQMVAEIPEDFLTQYATVADGYMAIVPETLMRFGRWEQILQEPEPRQDLLLARAMWRYARASALTALRRNAEAETERDAFARATAVVPPDRMMGNNYASNLLTIAAATLDGEMAAAKDRFDTAILKLQEAVHLEDQLRYDEPPDWIQPVRHTLGAVLLRAGRAEEAEQVYRDDLRQYPENGWSLMGLRDALAHQGKTPEAATTKKRFKKAWATADISPTATCYCQE